MPKRVLLSYYDAFARILMIILSMPWFLRIWILYTATKMVWLLLNRELDATDRQFYSKYYTWSNQHSRGNLSTHWDILLIHTSDANRIKVITTDSKCVFPHIEPNIFKRIGGLIPSLVQNGSTEIICCLLLAGSSMCASGFVSGRKTYLSAFVNYRKSFRWLSYFVLDPKTPCDGSQIIPETSSCSSDIGMYDRYEKDKHNNWPQCRSRRVTQLSKLRRLECFNWC